VSLDVGIIGSAADLLAIARAMEELAADQYAELAEAFAVSCNSDAADAFRELADGQKPNVAEFPALSGPAPALLPWGDKDPEIADPGAVHYLMWPWHVFDLALRHERKALAFFEEIAARSDKADVVDTARTLALREQGHVVRMQARRDAAPFPPEDWDDDPDPPNWDM
jgi:hypothetical protein